MILNSLFSALFRFFKKVAPAATFSDRNPVILTSEQRNRTCKPAEKERSVMKKGLTEVVFILDRSGSMGGLENDTIGGFNSMIKKQKKEPGEALISTVLFDDQTEILHDRKPLSEIGLMTDKEYYVRGCTALLDAMGGAISHVKKVRKAMPKEERPEKTLFIITTDGMENSSSHYTYPRVKHLIEKQQKKHHWEFVFLGANIDAIACAGKLGIRKERAVNYEHDGKGTKLQWKAMGAMMSCARSAESDMDLGAAIDSNDFLAEVREDYKKRHRA